MTRWSGTRHPLTGRFPTLEGDELRALAADIRRHGQSTPCCGGFRATVKPRVVDGKFSFRETTSGGTSKTLKVTGRFTTKTKARGTVTLTASKSGST
jgi:hypothetical protein